VDTEAHPRPGQARRRRPAAWSGRVVGPDRAQRACGWPRWSWPHPRPGRRAETHYAEHREKPFLSARSSSSSPQARCSPPVGRGPRVRSRPSGSSPARPTRSRRPPAASAPTTPSRCRTNIVHGFRLGPSRPSAEIGLFFPGPVRERRSGGGPRPRGAPPQLPSSGEALRVRVLVRLRHARLARGKVRPARVDAQVRPPPRSRCSPR